MYIIDRLFIAQQSHKKDTDYELAQYFLKNLTRLSKLSASTCIKESHVSKATLNRFYTKGGFKSYKDFIYELSHEFRRISLKRDSQSNAIDIKMLSIPNEILKQFMVDIKSAKKVCFYGCINDINILEQLHYFFIKREVEVVNLLQWDAQWNCQKLDELDDNDLFIIIDSQYSLSVLVEKSVIQSDMLKLTEVDKRNFKKYFIGIDKQHFTTFQTIDIFKSNDDFSHKVELLQFDRYLANAQEESK